MVISAVLNTVFGIPLASTFYLLKPEILKQKKYCVYYDIHL